MTGVLLVAALWSVDAQAAAPPPPPPPPPAAPAPPPDDKLKLRKRPRGAQHGVALSLGGGLASSLMVEGTGEVNLPDQHAVALILGVGSPQSQGQAIFARLAVEAGAQYRYTVKGDFDTGVWVGLEGLGTFRPLQLGVPWDVGVTPLVGFKYTAPFGLLADVSVGPSLVLSSYRPPRPSAALNVQVGWAFGKAPR